ncbi:hypothetical protein [Puia dinghuensis]|uniref:Uncharacterized protein n=1 Tax=Puia dinghuensis TaxID=1792502 RepID=A0A8J2UHS7_9BACT|nr:hypothetical protein [Puia dinghuensis]GGB19609.1 hypothetical protein GCM10011511_49180 [Puia dinghuensis]
MKKDEKKKKIYFQEGDLNLIVDENLNKLKGKTGSPEKLAEANRRLRKIKSLPK